ncbi:MAG: M48 family metalloprotease [Caulobacter sp.]
MPRVLRPRAKGLALLAAAVLAAAPAGAQPRAPHLRPAETSDEGGIWALSEKAELAARQSAERNRDPALNAYVTGVVARLAPEYQGDIRVYVMDRPFFNAQMAPNGYGEVWSGLLLRVQSEDELAFVLGHEVGHFAENHSIEAYRALKARLGATMAVQFAVAAVAMGAAVNAGSAQGANDIMRAAGALNDLLYLGQLAAYFGYSRENEVEADGLGFKRAVAAGYDPAAGATLWRALIAETGASSFKRVREQEARANIFSSHPVSSERVKALDELAARTPTKASTADRKAYRAVIRPHLAAWLKDDLRRRDYGQSLALIDRLAAEGEDKGLLSFYRAEAYRQRRGDGDLDLARKAYAEAGTYPDAPAAAWRSLGDLALQAGDRPAARTAYETYLARAPQAQDRWLVEASLKKLSEGSAT